MSEDLDQTAAAYVLGIARGAARAAIETRLVGVEALQTRVKLWQDNFAALDLAAGIEHPPREFSNGSLPVSMPVLEKFQAR
jgi:anti-sigma-K factor RskA